MKLYRVVSEEEAHDLEETGVFRHPYGGLEVKEFWTNEGDAISYLADAIRRDYSPPYVRLIAATLHHSLEELPHLKMELDGRAAIVVRGEALYRLNKVISIEWVNLNSND